MLSLYIVSLGYAIYRTVMQFMLKDIVKNGIVGTVQTAENSKFVETA